MNNKVTIGIVVFFLVCSGFTMYSYDRADDGIKLMSEDDYMDYGEVEVYGGNIDMEYQGPIPKGYDLEHFRKTGETIKEVIN